MQFNPIAKYILSKNLVVVDTLSQSQALHSTTRELEEDIKAYMDVMNAYRPVAEKRLYQLQKATSIDTQQ